ncbi:MAG: copper chaperone CopZ [Firmicutes bacterium]|uniref:Copper chaperone CopZ n=1 Tax=Melghirimyces thermohalophilus TaxID=1236220 RepID=A0A1G6KQJ4_9BACL|nr:copper chaperone CopZ [Melghirimyces thermohalophilus]MDA8352596.1 copper chaperone CopZ [Bacillota bacterium]SDC33177.1 copper chaperone [Melghirimyces thermohalophilus]
MATVTLKVEGMSCGHCKSAVEGALNKVKGVEQAQVDLEAGTATVKYDEQKTDLEKMKQAVEDQGYDVAS